jgi:hypothetical protein
MSARIGEAEGPQLRQDGIALAAHASSLPRPRANGKGRKMDSNLLLEEIERLGPWQQEIDLGGGVTTASAGPSDDPDKMQLERYSPERMMRRLLGNIFPEGLEGRSFLDCACNPGGHSIAAARMGAGRSFAFDARQHWIDQCAFLARTIPAPQLTCRRCTLADVPALGLEPFDVTLFSGIFYHLPDPVGPMRRRRPR